MSRRNDVMALFDAYKEETEEKVKGGIEAYRKGTFDLKIKDKDGNAVKGAKVRAVLKNHDFRFGANMLMLDEFETEEKNAAYRKDFAEMFNMGTVPFYWNALEPVKGKARYAADSPKIYRRPAPDLCLDFCEENHIEPREHALAYCTFFPEWLDKNDVAQNKREMERHFREIAERYADRINTIEVTNELYWTDLDKKPAIYKSPDYLEFSYKLAEKYFPANKLTVNEGIETWVQRGTTVDPYYGYIENTLLKGCRIDAVGLQYHMFQSRENYIAGTRKYFDPRHIRRILDLYAKFGKPLQITEVTIPAYSGEKEDEDLQAEVLTTVYKIWFSHPNMEQIVYWNLVDGYAYNAKPGDMTAGENYFYGGLIRFDFSKKPAYEALYNLIHKEWHTDVSSVTDEGGRTGFRGFYGEYDVTVETEKGVYTMPLHAKKGRYGAYELTIGG